MSEQRKTIEALFNGETFGNRFYRGYDVENALVEKMLQFVDPSVLQQVLACNYKELSYLSTDEHFRDHRKQSRIYTINTKCGNVYLDSWAVKTIYKVQFIRDLASKLGVADCLTIEMVPQHTKLMSTEKVPGRERLVKRSH